MQRNELEICTGCASDERSFLCRAAYILKYGDTTLNGVS